MNAVELTWDTMLRFHHLTNDAFLIDFVLTFFILYFHSPFYFLSLYYNLISCNARASVTFAFPLALIYTC